MWHYLKSSLKDFQAFAVKGSVLELAIGVSVGGAFTAVVSSIVGGIFTPLIAAVFGQANFSNLSFTINGSHFQYGLVINALFTLIAVASTLFFFVVKPVNAIKRRTGHLAVTTANVPCPACCTAINPAATRCPACTEALPAGWSQAS